MMFSATKCHGMGNDFIVVECDNPVLSCTQMSSFAAHLCDRAQVIGADGAVFIVPEVGGGSRVHTFNPDGTESELCINGTRCAGRLLLDKTERTSVTFETFSGRVQVEKAAPRISAVPEFRMSLPRSRLQLSSHFFSAPNPEIWDTLIPALSPVHRFYGICFHVPHLLILSDGMTLNELLRIGAAANASSTLFPRGVNVSAVFPLDNESLYVRTFERGGVGMSRSCASAMVASCLTLQLLGKRSLKTPISVISAGGFALCNCDASDGIGGGTISSNATIVFTCNVDYDPERNLLAPSIEGDFKEDEVAAYQDYWETLGIASYEKKFLPVL